MLSLYDYLGKAAGEKLGKEVWIAAAEANIPTEMRKISNPKYSGKVTLYPKDFLDFYFREPDTFEFEPTLGDVQDDDLPF